MRTSTRLLRRIRSTVFLPATLVLGLAACSSDGLPAGTTSGEQEHAGIAVTVWTEASELFFEYPPMVAGVESEPWAVHLTRLSDFSPVTEGGLELVFRAADGTVQSTVSASPARPGIYTPRPLISTAGTYQLAMIARGPQLSDTIAVGRVEVYATPGAIPHEEEAEAAGISFLKEQQWPIDFQVVAVGVESLPTTIEVTGVIEPAAGRVAEVASPVSGLARAQTNLNAPAVGSRVRAGQTMVVLSPTSQDNSFARAVADGQRLNREVERLERLFAAEAIPERRLIEARHDLELSQAALGAMGGASKGYEYVARSPISGIVQSRTFVPGQRVESGQSLFVVVDPDEVWLRLNIPASQTALVNDAAGASFTVEGTSRRYWSRRIVSIGAVIDPETRTLPVISTVTNSDRSLKIGQFAVALLEVGGARSGITIPNEAILREDGQPVAYVQIGGESFARRRLSLGETDGLQTLVESGLSAGEHVVTVGAYQVYLGSLSTSEIAAEGHAH